MEYRLVSSMQSLTEPFAGAVSFVSFKGLTSSALRGRGISHRMVPYAMTQWHTNQCTTGCVILHSHLGLFILNLMSVDLIQTPDT